ncbi:S1 family peptidase [Rhodobium gokarnense]|uniref:Serine protease n=1 Tax=Rhodobium gokarnense TaxID=364296 RepID=A0ABT3HC82_9HYPH|nr:serine protease [Rhodobium gokarnense]MCW2308000.1 hypothetical protein [Rhodobium gokarnense]
MFRMLSRFLVSLLSVALMSVPAASDANQAHDLVRKSLVYLTALGTPQTGDLVGVDDASESHATGFIVSSDGFVLTTEHFFEKLKEDNANRIKITGRIGDVKAQSISAQYISALESLDLVLLKLQLPYGQKRPAALTIGDTLSIDQSSPPKFLTSGFSGEAYKRRLAAFNDASNAEVSFAWTLNVKIGPGQSGSPVYLDDGTVVGVVKGTAKDDDEATLMIPIEYALPLIGHFRVIEMNRKIDWLLKTVGEVSDDDPPLHLRLNKVEANLEEIASNFSWEAESRRDGSLSVHYKKIIGGGPKIKKIHLSVQPHMKIRQPNADNIVISPMARLRLRTATDDPPIFELKKTRHDGRDGEFIIPDIQKKLKSLLSLTDGAVEGQRPFDHLELVITPILESDEKLPSTTIKEQLAYDWFE